MDDNIITGPWPGSEDGLDEAGNELTEEEQVAEGLTEKLIVQMMHTMQECGVDINETSFIKDTSLVIEFVNACIYRDMGIEHPLHNFLDNFVKVNIKNEMIHCTVDINFMADCLKTVVEKLENEKNDPEKNDPEPA
jgi:hypothetical protein